MNRSLHPRGAERVRAALRPGWARTVAARRALAAALALLALAVAVTSRPGGPTASVVAAARALAPGRPITEADLTSVTVPAALIPDGVLRTPGAALGHAVTGPVAAGELLTSRRLLTDRTAGHLREGGRLVPVSLADAAVMDLLRPGDSVDVVAQPARGDDEPVVLARGAVVAVAPAPGAKQRAAMLAMAEDEAHAVAAAALVSPLSVVFR
ncbi:SAF domain-containing protein [Tsukamurella sp. 8F]|uniref:SAF domain-containing protein n=1 Tax=unclassified Tsukamurella TaxID=2633480 RepID=UPI0023B8E50F|nr:MULTISPECIES: SAF domain-containing protein [unclassified Tsukamurella]MDF0532382.1 SAF domain-containing protein [Tsukamurella sp. 8J]MDF0588632.1 SAF domain-containing protein [Tsukamurella sp. 8F]